MVRYPVRVDGDHYRGRDERRRRKQREHNELAELLERHINDKIEANSERVQIYLYAFLAHELGLWVEDVRRVLFSLDCGHNGFTVVKDGGSGEW